ELAGIKYYEIKVVDPDKRDIEVYPDVNSGLKMRRENGHIYLRADFENIVALRRNFRYFAPKTQDGASRISVIVLTTKERTEEKNFSMKEIILESPEYLGKIYEEKHTTLWETERGLNYIGATKHNISGEGAKVPEAPAADFKEERMANMPATTYREIERIQGENKRNLSDGTKEANYQSLSLRDGFEGQIKDIYKKIAVDLKKGNPDIGDTTGIIDKINENIGDAKMNTKEANEAQRLIQNEYFINLWERPNKAAIVRRFENNNRIILEKVLLPAFEKAVINLGVRTPAMDLVTQVNAAAVDKFKAKITEYEASNGAIKTKDDVRAFIEQNQTDISEGMLAKTGTTNRETKGGRFTTYTSSFEAVKNSLILEPTDWSLNSDVGKVLQEILNPTPSIENPESLIDNPFVMQLLTTKAAGIEMGVENYTEISRFYKLTNSEQRNELANPSPKLKEAVIALETLVKRIKEAQTKGETKISLQNGADLSFDIPKAETASYIVCGNHTLLLSQPGFRMRGQDVKGGSVTVGENSAFIKPDVKNGVDVWSLAAGVTGAAAEEEETEDKPKDDTPGNHDTPEGPKAGGPTEVRLATEGDVVIDNRHQGGEVF
nr:hypothetical protein [Candidatus Paceibacterota bacterium]